MDRGMVSEDNLEFLRSGGRRYIVGTPKSLLKKYEQELLKDDWRAIRDGLEVKLCPAPPSEDAEQSSGAEAEQEIFILCRSRDRYEKDAGILRRFEEKIETRLQSMAARCAKQKRDPMKVEREVGRLLGQNTRAAKLFEVTVESTDTGHARLTWRKLEIVRDWASLSAGCYLLRTNVRDWTDEELWKTYMQLTEAEAAFRIQKSDLSLRPIWHQKQERVLAHILVCFLAYVLWKTLGQLCERAGLGNEPRQVLDELSEVRTVDVILPTSEGTELRKRCIAKPSEHQAILLDHLGLTLPSHLNTFEFEM
jgi:transposase